jgi:hypothetical protein
LAEITTDSGDTLMPQAYGLLQTNKTPQLWTISQSSLQWPVQALPSKKAWCVWKKFLKTNLNAQNKLLQPLGAWYSNYNDHRQWTSLSDGFNLIKKTNTTNLLYQRIETRSRHNITFSVVRPTKQLFKTPCLPITPIKDDTTSITSKQQEFHLIEPAQYNNSGTYTMYHIPDCDLTNDPIEFTYRIRDDEKHLEIVGVVLQHDKPKKILRLNNKYYFDKPKQLARNAWGCLLFASFLSTHQLTQPTTIHVSNNTIQKKLREITSQTSTPNNCFSPE